MPRTKVRLNVMVDRDVADYLEEGWDEATKQAIDDDRAKPSFSGYVNKKLRQWIRTEKEEAL